MDSKVDPLVGLSASAKWHFFKTKPWYHGESGRRSGRVEYYGYNRLVTNLVHEAIEFRYSIDKPNKQDAKVWCTITLHSVINGKPSKHYIPDLLLFTGPEGTAQYERVRDLKHEEAFNDLVQMMGRVRST